MADIEFVNGLMVKAPHERAPDYVKASISIKVSDLTEWLQGRTEEWVNLDVKAAKSGKWYAAVNTFKKQSASAPTKSAKGGDDLDSDVPF
jgi:hypothetical protein